MYQSVVFSKITFNIFNSFHFYKKLTDIKKKYTWSLMIDFKFLSLFCNFSYNENNFIISKYDVVQHICCIRIACFFVQIIVFKLCLLICYEKNHTIFFQFFS